MSVSRMYEKESQAEEKERVTPWLTDVMRLWTESPVPLYFTLTGLTPKNNAVTCAVKTIPAQPPP